MMSEERTTRTREIEVLRGFVHSGPSSAWTRMRYKPLQRRHPNEYARLWQENSEKGR
jgi:hypothetical protein